MSDIYEEMHTYRLACCEANARADKLQAQLKDKDVLIAAQKEYISLLGEELNETGAFAYTHGWHSSRCEAGKKLRARIEQVLKGD